MLYLHGQTALLNVREVGEMHMLLVFCSYFESLAAILFLSVLTRVNFPILVSDSCEISEQRVSKFIFVAYEVLNCREMLAACL